MAFFIKYILDFVLPIHFLAILLCKFFSLFRVESNKTVAAVVLTILLYIFQKNNSSYKSYPARVSGKTSVFISKLNLEELQVDTN